MIERNGLMIVDNPRLIDDVVRGVLDTQDAVTVGIPTEAIRGQFSHTVQAPIILRKDFPVNATVVGARLVPHGDAHELQMLGQATVNDGEVIVDFAVGVVNGDKGLRTVTSHIRSQGNRLAKIAIGQISSGILLAPGKFVGAWLDNRLATKARTTDIRVGQNDRAGLILEFQRAA